ncbi:MAG: hypothetical protein Q4D73_07175 [Actinomycetaceae bacterium]|nr:hypothetical protein [Actinomycetaceae bacterium]
MTREAGTTYDYYEIGKELSDKLLQVTLKFVPEAEDDPDFSFYRHQNAGHFEDAFTAAAGYLWKRKKRLPDEILDKWDAFIYDPGDECDFYDMDCKYARECLDLQRALPKE